MATRIDIPADLNDEDNDGLVPISVLRAERDRLRQTLAGRPSDPAPDLKRLAAERRDAQRRLADAGKDWTRIQHELNEVPLIGRLRHRERRTILEHDLNYRDREIDAQTARLHQLQRQRDDLRPAWRAWHAEHKPDLDRLSTLRLRICVAENLRPAPAQAEQAPAPALGVQPEPGGIDLAVRRRRHPKATLPSSPHEVPPTGRRGEASVGA